MKTIFIFVVKLYRTTISAFMPVQCRFHPTCSQYMIEAIEKRGVWRGTLLGVKRILKCNPLFPGGYDPVP
ncbi:MAG: membrane protein insertion efficiency factor YidD [Syntrophorhabdaceae bacterium]